MRKPDTIEYLYLDFDGFFASVEQQARPHLRGKPVGIVPFDNTQFTCVIACSKEAKARGCSNVMRVADAKAKCPELILQPQTPDLYRRAHNTLIAEIGTVVPVEAVKSIDELTCCLEGQQRYQPYDLARQIKDRIASWIGYYLAAFMRVSFAKDQDCSDWVYLWKCLDWRTTPARHAAQ